MLHRPTTSPAWSPARRLAERLSILVGPSSGLLRYVLIAALLAAIGCLYLWQVNDLSTLHETTVKLEWEARTLEQQNVVLAEQLAQWSSPAYVDKVSAEQGYVVTPKRVVAASTDADAVAAAAVTPEQTR